MVHFTSALFLSFSKKNKLKQTFHPPQSARHFAVDTEINHLLPHHGDFYACCDMCALQWITFQMELFARKTLYNIVLDLCTLHTQTCRHGLHFVFPW